jgi:formylglycine-generating enzyme required for sulfatase activity
MQPTTVEYAASSGQPIRYRERSVNAAVEWERMPVSGVSRDDATEYSRWLDETARVPGARLCTEAEWEFAARGGDGRRFPSGDALPAADANTQEKYARRPEAYGPDEVGSNPRSVSPFDVHDLAGNVWDVTTTLDGSVTVARGGAFSIDRTAARSDTREVIEAGLRDPTLGVRICADLAQ